MCVPALNTMNMARVNITFCLSSVILNMLARAANTLDHLNLTASCNDFFFSGFAEAHSLNSKFFG